MLSEYKIVQKSTPNKFDRKGWKPDMIVSHITEGSYAGAVSWLMNPISKASSHFVVSQKGEITQLVDLKEAAWINGTSTDSKNNIFYGKSTLDLVRNRKTNANYYTIGIEHEGFYAKANGKLTEEQFKATVWLHKHIRAEVKRIYGIDIPVDREHIIGHYQITPISKPNCPGQSFQWDALIKALREDVVNMLIEKWQAEMGLNALDSLFDKKIVDSPDKWKQSLGENVPQWLFWAIVDRITEEGK